MNCSTRRWIVMGVAVQVLCLDASEALAESEAGAGLFGGSVWTAVFTIVIFGILVGVLGKFAWGPMLEALKKREDTIRGDLDGAKTQRQEAQEVLEEYQSQLAGAQQQGQEVLDEAHRQAIAEQQEIIAQAQKDARSHLAAAQQEIASAQQAAVRQVYCQSVEMAGKLAAKILSRQMEVQDQEALTREALDELDALSDKDRKDKGL